MFQISGIHNSIEPKKKQYSPNSSFGDSCGEVSSRPCDSLCRHNNEEFSHLLASFSPESESRAERAESGGKWWKQRKWRMEKQEVTSFSDPGAH